MGVEAVMDSASAPCKARKEWLLVPPWDFERMAALCPWYGDRTGVLRFRARKRRILPGTLFASRIVKLIRQMPPLRGSSPTGG